MTHTTVSRFYVSSSSPLGVRCAARSWSRAWYWATIAMAVVGLFPAMAAAQNAQLSGLVRDGQGAVVSSADLRLIRPDTGVVVTSKSNDRGLYVFASVAPATYRLEASAPGFATATYADVILNVDQRLTMDVTLTLNGHVESVTVSGRQSLLSAADGSVGTVFDRTFVQNLPLLGRSFSGLVTLAPGAVTIAPSGSSFLIAGSGYNVNGQRSTANSLTIDGVAAPPEMTNNTGQAAAGQRPASTVTGTMNGLVSMDALQEIRIQTSTFAAEFGRTPGAQVSLVTRSGTNTLHGALFEQFRNDRLIATDWFANSKNIDKPDVSDHQFGVSVGGPLFPDRTFYFVSYEGLRVAQPRLATRSVPSIEARQRPSAVQSLLNLYPMPTGPSRPDLTAEYTVHTPRETSVDTLGIRVDHTVMTNMRLFGRYSRAPSDIEVREDAPIEPTSLIKKLPETLTGGLTATLRSNMLIDVRASYGTTDYLSTAKTDATLRAFFPAGDALEFFPLDATFLSHGPAVSNVQSQTNVAGSFSFLAGRHHLKAGLDYRRVVPTLDSSFAVQARFQNVLQAITSTQLTQLTVTRIFPIHGRFHSHSFYVQDTWKPLSRLSATYGIRWDINPAPAFALGEGPLRVTTFAPLSQVALSPTPNEPLWRTDYGNVYPRLGFSYTPRDGSRFMITGGVGVFGDLTGLALANGLVARASTTATNVQLPLKATDIPSLEPRVYTPPYSAPLVVDPNLETPMTTQWNLGVERTLGTNQAVSVTYVGANGRHLMQTSRYGSLNPTIFPGNATIITAAGRSEYHALQVQYRRRAGQGLNVQGSYTLSDSKDTTSEVTVSTDRFEGLSPATFDVRHNASVAVSWNVPNTNPWGLGWLVRDWGMHLLGTARSGYPFSVIGQTVTVPGEEIFTVRASFVPDVPVIIEDASSPGGKRFNRAAFVAPPAGQQGNTGRNAFRGFAAYQVDFGMARRIRLASRLGVQIRADIFNVFNHPTFSLPNAVLTASSATFGQPTSMVNTVYGSDGALFRAGGPRSAALSLRVDF